MTRPPKDEDPTVVRANADTRLGSKRVRQLPTDSGEDVAVLDSAESAADAFDAPQATELLDPANLPDAIKNSLRNRRGAGAAPPQKQAPPAAPIQPVAPPSGFPKRDDDATVTFDPASLEQAHPERTLARPAGNGAASSTKSADAEPWEDRTVAADALIASSFDLNGQEEAGFAPPTGAEFVPPVHTLPDHIDSVPDPLSDTDDAKRPSWLGSAHPVDLGLSETAQASPFADEKQALPGAGAFGPIDPDAVQGEAGKRGGRGKIFALLASFVVVTGSVAGAFALGVFDDGDLEVSPPPPENQPAVASPATATPAAATPEATPTPVVPEGSAPDGAVTSDGVATEASTPTASTPTPPVDDEPETNVVAAAAAAPNAKPVPIGFVRVLDNTESKLPELAETLQQALLREIKNHSSLDATLGPVPVGHLVELRLQTIEIGEAPAPGARRKAEADCSLVVRPTPLEGDAETRNAHAAIETGLAVTSKLERSAVATLAIAACGKALAVSLVGYSAEHPIDWTAAAAAIAAKKSTTVEPDEGAKSKTLKSKTLKSKTLKSKTSKDAKLKKRKRRGKAIKKRRRRRASTGSSSGRSRRGNTK